MSTPQHGATCEVTELNATIEPLADAPAIAAKRLGICRAQLYKELGAGRLIARKLGRRTLIARSEQERWMDALPVRGAAA